MKKNTQEQYEYLKRIPNATVLGYFKKTEIETETFG